MSDITKGLPQTLGDAFSDIGDSLGIGSARREREFNAQQAELNRSFQSREAQKQRDWEQMMSDTAYRRAFNDMQAAGINPAMVFSNGGNAASTPTGASASGSQAHSSAGGSGNFASIINSAARLSYSFNSDKNTANDMNTKQMVDTMIKLADLVK